MFVKLIIKLKYSHMDSLRERIIERIKRQGPITFEAFMEMALYEPGLGYYMSPQTEIGRAGDYYTSPHLHPIFGAMLGRQIIEMWQIMDKPSSFNVIEMGAGRGYLAKDMLSSLKDKEIFSYLTYTIVEMSPFMTEKQKDLLSEFKDKVLWMSSIEELGSVCGCVLSNELLDSFPVHVIEMEDELKEIYISFEKDRFLEVKGILSRPEIYEYIRDFVEIKLVEGYKTEVNLRIKGWLKDISDILSEGFIITIDYGYPAWQYYSEERTKGTLLCYEGHQVNEDFYENIGRKDITTHVNFSSLKRWAEDIGFKTLGFLSQGSYLVSLGITEMITELYAGSPDYLFEVAKIKGLLFPGTMGETHKVMVHYKGGRPLSNWGKRPLKNL